ncbi:DUF624 domain-containing protein [Actinobaculum suis]|uniref:DUF624 domain-containing protein n=1 Tax=Actinobaculum suis TaxID=1657 RepID=UPI0009E1C710|nr:DUF624 domain-containing protein [Actinobaculum suis]
MASRAGGFMQSRLWEGMEIAANVVLLNAVTLLACLPVITSGAAFTACGRQVALIVRGEEGAVLRGWWQAFRRELRQSFAWWIPCLLLGAALLAENYLLGQVDNPQLAGIGSGLLALGGCLLLAFLAWMVPLTAFFENTVLGHAANALLYVFGKPLRTALCVVVMLALPAGYLFVPVLQTVCGWIFIFLGIALPLYMCALIQKPELDRLLAAP